MKPIDLIPEFAPKHEVRKVGHEHYQVSVQAPAFMCQPTRHVILTEDQFTRYELWRDGKLYIQDALPELSPDEREILMSGLGPDMGGLADDE
jgi:hypothetical protein